MLCCANQNIREEFLNDIVNISTNISEYMNNKLYLTEVEDIDSINDGLIFNLVVDMTLGELSELGIIIDAGEELYHEVDILKMVLDLRRNFAYDKLLNKLSSNDELSALISSIVDSEEYDPELLIQEIIGVLASSFPLSEVWPKLVELEDNFHNTDAFIQYINYTLENAESNSPLSEIETDNLIKYTEMVVKHVNRVSARIKAVIAVHDEVDTAALEDRLGKHDVDLVRVVGKELSQQYLYDGHPTTTEGSEVESILDHKRSKRHHIEYFELHTDEVISVEDVIFLVADLNEPTLDNVIDMTDNLTDTVQKQVVDIAKKYLFTIQGAK